MDPKRDLKIKLLRERGKTYEEIKKELHVGRSTISKVLAMRGMRSRTGLSRTATSPLSPEGGGPLYREKRTIEPKLSFIEKRPSTERTFLGGSPKVAPINGKGTKIVGGPGGLGMSSIDNPGHPSNSHSIINTPLPSWLGKLFFVFIGIVIFIRILRKIREDALEDF